MSREAVSLSSADRARVDDIERLVVSGPRGIPALLDRLLDPSWAVRRAVVAGLAALGDAAVAPMLDALVSHRESEARVAALVDALVASAGDPTPGLEALASTGVPAVLCDAAAILGRRRSRTSASTLAAWVGHPDDNVAVASLEALGRIGGAAGLDAVIGAASSANFFRVFPAIDVLGRSGDARAIGPLTALLSDPVCALEAARALGRTGDLAAADALVRLLTSPNEPLVRVAVLALADIDDEMVRRLGASGTLLPSLQAISDPGAASRRITQSFERAEPAERVALCRALGWLGVDSAAASLVELLGVEPETARAAAVALRQLGPVGLRQILAALEHGDSARRFLLLPLVPMHFDATSAVVACLDDPDSGVRARACEILGRIGNVAAVPSLFARLADPDAGVAQAAVGALHGLGSADTQRLALAGARAEDPRVRRAAVRMIGYFGWAGSLETLSAARADTDPRVRDAATQSLAFLDDPRALDMLLEVSRSDDPRARASAMRALGQLEPSATVHGALVAGLRDADAWVRYHACRSLARPGGASVLDEVLPLISDPAPHVQVAAIETLAVFADDRAVSALLHAAASSDGDVRRAALVGLGITRAARGAAVVLEALRSDDLSTRLVALSAAAAFELDETAEAVAASVGDPDPTVRAAALGFLGARPGVRASERLIALLDEERLRDEVALALSQYVRGRVPALLAALEAADDSRARLLVSVLSRIGRPDARAALGVALAMDRPEPRRAAAAALSAVDSALASALLASLASTDPDPEVRRLAAFATSRR